MKLESLINLHWWQKELKDNPKAHYAPLCMMGGTTALVTAYWGRYHALGFLTTAVLSYPFFHSQIEYLTYLDVHETTFAVAIVAIQFFNISFPFRLFLSVALAYSITVRGMKIREAMHKLGDEIKKHAKLNEELQRQVSSLDSNMQELDKALNKLIGEVLQKKTISAKEKETLAKEGSVAVELDFRQIKMQINELTGLCNKLIEDKNLSEQLKKMDDNNGRIQLQTKIIEGHLTKIGKLESQIKEANDKLLALVDRAGTNEALLKQELQSFHQWLLEIRIG
jgi:DNA-binding HxlR family transcriptional regulator